jgi:hypothetical protein
MTVVMQREAQGLVGEPFVTVSGQLEVTILIALLLGRFHRRRI